MGEVYRARDTRLGRDVAIKTVNAPFTERFEREAQAISALNHPHICTLYDVGSFEGATPTSRTRPASPELGFPLLSRLWEKLPARSSAAGTRSRMTLPVLIAVVSERPRMKST